MANEENNKLSRRRTMEEEIAETAYEEIFMYSLGSMAWENQNLNAALAIIDAMIASRELDQYTSVGLVVKILTDKEQVNIFVNAVAPTSPFFRNIIKTEELVKALSFWEREEQVISEEDTLSQARELLNQRLESNKELMPLPRR